jgi:dienelactone hydrolase
VISWAHGTTGIADSCAPTIAGDNGGYALKLQNAWLKKGYAVVRTDYEGLGTPGDHPYLLGVSEGRSVLDMALAARKLEPSLSKNLVISGHSQGGQAALWAASLAPKWASSEKLKGTVAFAPVSHLAEQSQLLSALKTPSNLSGLVAMILDGVNIADPALAVPSLLSDRTAALWPQVSTTCLAALDAPTSFGGVAPADFFKPGANTAPITAFLSKNEDPEDLKIKTPVQIEQGMSDTTVLPTFTQLMAAEYKKNHVDLTYKTYSGLTHGTVVTSAKPEKDASAFIKHVLK